MSRTVNRIPASFNLPSKNDKYFNQTSFKGLATNKNIVAVDQESFADCKNVYVNDENLLTSRPPLVYIDSQNINNVWVFNDIELRLTDDGKLTCINYKQSIQYTMKASYKFECIQVEDKIYLYTDLLIDGKEAFWCFNITTRRFEDAIDYIYIPITKLVTNNVDENFETKNFLTSAEKTRFLYSALSFVDFARLMGKKVTVNLDNKEYVINEWQQDNEKVLVSAYSNTNKDDYIDIKESYGVNIILKYNKKSKIVSVSFDGVTFKNLPYVDTIVPNTVPYLSEDGFNVFIFTTTCLKRCTIATLAEQIYEQKPSYIWEDIPYCERDTDYKDRTLNNKSRAYGSFISSDLYAYIITCENPIRADLQTAILYAQWTVKTTNKYCIDLLSLDTQNLQEPFMKFYYQNLTVNEKSIPNLVSIIVDNRMARSLNLVNDYNTNAIVAMMIKEYTSTSNIYNNAIVYLTSASFYRLRASGVWSTVGGYIPRDEMQYMTNQNIFGFKIQRWTVDGNTAVIDTSNTQLKYGDYVSLVPLLYNYPTEDSYIKYYVDENEIPIPPFRKQTGLKQDLYAITGGTGNLSSGAYITFMDQHDYDGTTGGEDIKGNITTEYYPRSDNKYYKFDKKIIQLNYHATDSEPDIQTLKNNLTFHQIFGEDNKPDSFMNIVVDDKKVRYDFKVIAALAYRYNDAFLDSQRMVANVLSNFSIIFDTDTGSYTIPTKTSIMKKIPFYNREFDTYITDIENSIRFDIENFAWRFKFSKSGQFILSDQYYYDIEREKVINLVVYDVGDVHSERTQQPILFGDYIYYTYNNKLYTNKLMNEISLDIVNNTHKYTAKVFDKKAVLNEYFLSFDNLLQISDIRRSINENNDFLWYLPQANEFKYFSKIQAIHPLSTSEIGVFLENEIWIVRQLSELRLWQNIKTKLNLGIMPDSDVSTLLSGEATLLVTQRGIASLSYENFVQSSDQVLNFISDDINDFLITKPLNTMPSLKIIVYKYWIIFYSVNTNKILLFDMRSNSWWYWECKQNITKMFILRNDIWVLSNKKLYCFHTSENIVYNDSDYIDNQEVYDVIDWSFTSQKLHLNSINKYKMINNIQIIALGDGVQTCDLETKVYRNALNPTKNETVEIKINDLRTFVKTVKYLNVQQFQYTLKADLSNIQQSKLKLNSLSIKYQIKGDVK